MTSSRFFVLATLLSTGSLMVACSDEFDDAPAGGTKVDGGAGNAGGGGAGGSAGTGATGGWAPEAGSGGTQTGGTGANDAGPDGSAGDAATGGVGGDAGQGGSAGDAGQGGSAGDAGQGGSAGDAGQSGSVGDAGPDAAPCPTGYGDCDGDDANGCETPLSSIENCGSCDNACGAPDNATATCENGSCAFDCSGSYEDCDGNATNGCETDTTTNVANCGSCSAPCPSGGNGTPTCSNATCGINCSPTWEDCDGNLATGCEIQTSTNPLNCGACNNACPTPDHATPTCNGSQCGYACVSGWADCNGQVADGCEVNLNADLANCGGCGHQCGSAHGTPSCSIGACSIQCDTNYGDCDGANANGCEVNLTNTDEHCGSCGTNCLGGSCTSSLCSAWPLVSIQHADWAGNLAANSTHLYWANGSAVYRASMAGGSPELLATIDMATYVAVDGTYVYVASPKPTTGIVYQIPLAGGTAQPIAINQNGPNGLAVDDSYIYWGYQDGVRRKHKTSGTVDLVTGYANVRSIALDATAAYFVSRTTPGRVAWVAKSGGTITELIGNQESLVAVVVDADSVYFTKSNDLMKIGKNGYGATVLASGYGSLQYLDVDDAHVFFTNGSGGLVVQAPKVPGPVITRHTGGFPVGLQVVSGVVYWYDVTEDLIYAMVK